MLKEFLTFFFVSVVVVSCAKTQCKHDSECGSDECCYYHEGPMIASKRQFVDFGIAGMVQGGWCEKYLQQGQSCSSIATMNGHCGCATGLTCKVFQDPTLSILIPPRKRSMVFGSHSECQP